MAEIPLRSVAQILGLTSSGLFAGYTIALSHATIPSILYAATSTGGPKDEELLLNMWRKQYLMGFYVAIPATFINVVSWSYLAYLTPKARILYFIALFGTGTGTIFAWTLLRSTNGALGMRSFRLAGPGPHPTAPAMTYALNEKGSVALDKKLSTKELVERWGFMNACRGALLGFGTLIGAYAVISSMV